MKNSINNDAEQQNPKDHRDIGRDLELFIFNDVAPGAPFWLPKGMIIFRELEKWLQRLYKKENILEVSTPILVNKKLWERSGHWEKFKENMFVLKDGEQEFGLKPMNCPEAALIYESDIRSYNDLPLRYAEIGRLHRNEVSGSLGGLFRVRQLTMDDLHIFCTPEQIQDEITRVLQQFQFFFKTFGFAKVKYFLSTKPDVSLGDAALWENAENALKVALKNNAIDYQAKDKEGAFYGPKIDVDIEDSQGRKWQLSTVQLDFNIPERFKLKYTASDGTLKQPVIVHRAIFGTFERFIGILLEHTQGALPTWLSPVQVKLLPVSDQFTEYAKEISKKLEEKDIRVEIDASNESVGYKVRNAEMQKTPYYAVIGQKEKESGKLAVKIRNSQQQEFYSIEEIIHIIKKG